jgi:phosphatidylinositol glycan class B
MQITPTAEIANDSDKIAIRNLFYRAMALSLFIHLVTAFFSSGFHHYDEHYSILEFANFKLGNTPAEALPWDFSYKIRPWFQPAVLYEFFRGLARLGIDDPFRLATASRLLSSVLAWSALWALLASTLRWFATDGLRKAAIWLTALLWFIPYLDARASSENWSGALFFLGLALLLSRSSVTSSRPRCHWDRWAAFSVGALWGFSFDCRFQTGFLIAGAVLWALIVARAKFSLTLLSGFTVAFAVGLLLDHWGYGVWNFTPWNYYLENIIHGKAAEFGVSPWYDYFPRVLAQAVPPISLLVVALTLVATLRYPLNPLVWVVVPFLVAHSVIGHKELRFIFPVAAALPTLSVLGLQTFKVFRTERLPVFFNHPLWKTVVGLNVVLLTVVMFRPIRFEIPFFKKVYQTAARQDWKDLYYLGQNPYDMAAVRSHFYRPKNTELRHVDSVGDLLESVRNAKQPLGILWSGPETTLPSQCSVVYKTLPPWLTRLPWVDTILRRTHALDWTLYQCS